VIFPHYCPLNCVFILWLRFELWLALFVFPLCYLASCGFPILLCFCCIAFLWYIWCHCECCFLWVILNERANSISTNKSHSDKIIYPRLSCILLHTPGARQATIWQLLLSNAFVNKWHRMWDLASVSVSFEPLARVTCAVVCKAANCWSCRRVNVYIWKSDFGLQRQDFEMAVSFSKGCKASLF
jgi:hypothetical protein